jgi:thiol-disulfide isomerase/thioredoxin
MKWLYLFFLLPTLAFSAENFELNLKSDESISIDMFHAEGKRLYLYLPSERGLGKGYKTTAEQLSRAGKDFWALDLHTSFMIPKHRSSIDKFKVDDILDVLDFSKKQGFQQLFIIASGRGTQLALKVAHAWQVQNPQSDYLKGLIFHSPHLIYGRPKLGTQAQYVDSAKNSNLPIYLFFPQYSTKYFRAAEISKALQTGGSSVFIHRLTDVQGGFHQRLNKKLSGPSLRAKNDLSAMYLRATQLLLSVESPKILSSQQKTQKSTPFSFSEPTLTPYLGEQSIGLVLKNLAGEVVNLSAFKGEVVLLNFWASWCGPCVKEIPSLMRLKAILGEQNFKIITVNVGESGAAIKRFMKKVPFDLPILLDESGEMVKNWGVYAYPSNFLLDKNGVIRYSYRGALAWDAPAIVKTIKSLL